jgi:hypothetical protein
MSSNKKFINAKFKKCLKCGCTQEPRYVLKNDLKLGGYYCKVCDKHVPDSFVLVRYTENGSKIIGKKIKALTIFNQES